jgi:hypothetical protein
MSVASRLSPAEERIMARLKLSTFGINMDEERFREMLADTLHAHYRAIPSIDELLIRPREASRYCDRVRDQLSVTGEEAAYDLPDDAILRTLLNMRKHG